MNAAPDRTVPPPAGPERPFQPPSFRRSRLDNGLELVLAPRPGVPLVELSLLLPAGGELNPPDRPGLSAMTAALVDEGTRRRSGIEIATALEQLGTSLAAGADWDCVRLDGTALTDDLPALLGIVAEIAREPSFPPAEVERLRAQSLAEILRRPDHPSRLADRALAAALFAGTPFEELLQGSAPSVEAMTRDEIVGFHAAAFRPSRGHLVLCGDFDGERAAALAATELGDWRPGDAPTLPEHAPATARRTVTVVDLPRAPQAEIRIGHRGVPRTHPDRTRLGVVNALLGGKFTSRLNLNLRERHGYTYGVSSRFVDRRTAGPFVVGSSVATDVAGAAIAEVLSELDRLRDEPVAVDELEETKRYLRGVYPYTFQTLSGQLARLADLALHGLPDDHFEVALAVIDETSVEDVRNLAVAHLRPAEAAIVVAGPAAELTSQLQRFGSVDVVAAG